MTIITGTSRAIGNASQHGHVGHWHCQWRMIFSFIASYATIVMDGQKGRGSISSGL